MNDGDYGTVSAIANERPDIGITASSTPTGRRSTFYRMCNGELGYTHWHVPSQRSPLWTEDMEIRAKTEFTQQEYEHEVLAEFGTEEMGVFNKDDLDFAQRQLFYTYDPLNKLQERALEGKQQPLFMIYDRKRHAPQSLIRTCGIDWDKYGAGSSIIVLDYDIKMKKFIVIKRIEVPRGEYSLDNAVNTVIEVNDVYDPRWIFVDRGYGDYQLERLHIYGEMHPNSGLKNKVIGYQFKQLIDVPNPVKKTFTKEPLKPFMVNSLVKAFEDHRIILSPFDDILHKQLVDYVVDKITQSGLPVYTSKNEHFVDALGLAYLAMVLKFPEVAGFIKEIEHSSKISVTDSPYNFIIDRDIRRIESVRDPWSARSKDIKQIGKGPGERAGEYQQWVKAPEKITAHGYNLTVSSPKPVRSGNPFGAFSRNPRGGGGGRTLW